MCVVLCLLTTTSTSSPEGVYLPPPRELVDIPQNKGSRMYVDPRTYQSTSQAVSTVATEIPPKYVKLLEEIGGGECMVVMCICCLCACMHMTVCTCLCGVQHVL